MKIWKNGAVVPADAAVDAFDRGVMLGDGLFETMAFRDGTPLRLNRHLARLGRGLDVLGIIADINVAEVQRGAAALSDATDVNEGALRLTVLRGVGARGVLPVAMSAPTILMSLTSMTLCDTTPLNVIIARSTRRNDQSPMSAIKSTNYGDAILARMEADDAGADDAVLLNTRGTVAEATAANVFCVIDGQLVTPPLSDGALPGVMRDIVLEQESGTETTITEVDLIQAEEVFLTSSISIRPVISINKTQVGDGQPGPIARRLATLPGTAI
jgi:branched-chain amino acid aminotransferase